MLSDRRNQSMTDHNRHALSHRRIGRGVDRGARNCQILCMTYPAEAEQAQNEHTNSDTQLLDD